MKLQLLLCLQMILQVLSLTDEQLMIDHVQCLFSSHVEKANIERARLGEDVDDINFKKYLSCFFKRIGFQNDEGFMDYNVVREVMPQLAHIRGKDDPTTAINKCEAVKPLGPTHEDTAYLNYKCYMGI